MDISNWNVLLRLCLAALIGTVLGIEREYNHKPAGTRTHILVCLSACIISMISAYGFNGLGTVSDPARLMVGILTGIGFIGAGIIWRADSGSVQGITTAAEIFTLSALGIGCGLGLYFLAIVGAIITLITVSANDIAHFLSRKLGKEKPAPEPLADLARENSEAS